jgi:hypothetical protein
MSDKMVSILEGLRNKQLKFKDLKPLQKDFEKFLSSLHVFIEDSGIVDDSFMVYVSGDWKHDHLRLQYSVIDYFNGLGYDVDHREVVEGESDSDDYSASHYFRLSYKD